ncbi:class I SAM-dependent methyltransferase [Candidatus Odyssella thessalonicensis]|uniref:class I SAM-dependent methyltransferase n=1 Tax=Candidatus Odyssella thessalonicensis TaxID=84647 RepID=UPI000225B255|nr:class I SAM-dependent methyltransferase [Candidatus Odyssella thessalonicensis]
MYKAPEFVISIIQDYWEHGRKILEIGCGPAFLRKVFAEDYIGTDITDSAYNDNLLRDVDIVCPADQLLIEDNSMDIVIIKSAFYLFDNPGACLKEAKRVLKQGGKLIIFDYNRKTQKELQLKEGHERYPCWTQWGLKKLVQNNGFSNVENLIATNRQPLGFRKIYSLLRQEILGNWAIVCGTKR